MKLIAQYMGHDDELYNFLYQSHDLSVHRIDSLDDQVHGDILIVCDQVLHYNDLHVLAKYTHQKKYYLYHKNEDEQTISQIETICDSANITMVPVEGTVDQQARCIIDSLGPSDAQRRSNVVCCFSTIANIGLTSTVLSVATSIQSVVEGKIGVLGLNAWDDGVDHLPYKGKYLNEVKTQLTNQLLTPERLRSYFHYDDKLKFHYLGGNQNTKMERLFTTQEIDYLITLAQKAFDLVIIDAGSHFDNANLLRSLLNSDLKLLIVNQQRKAIKKFEQQFQHVISPLGYTKTDFLLILNAYVDDPGLPSEKDIYTDLGIPYLTSVPSLNHIGISSETHQKLLYFYENSMYQEAIDHIARGIIGRTRLKVKQTVTHTKPRRRWQILTRLGV
ncbi:hypothetical protein [Caldalkalibacillus salinus]|uniref:hypothetical protein n=1 Tax=Caldalkalibacillus salinus TaxID=2803787 RepID=UPI001924B482|nr:hypothetical protein [Caldalkalibacillus salinus]